MSRRRISSTKRLSRLKRSSGELGELEDDSNVFDTDDPNWYKRVEANNTRLRPSFQLSNAEETIGVLDSESDVETVPMGPPPANWWKSLSKFDQTLIKSSDATKSSRPNISTRPSEDDSYATEESLDSEPDKNLRNRKKRLYLKSQTPESLGGSAFLKALNDSVVTAISDPGSSKKRKSMSKMTFLSDEDSFKRTENSRHSGSNEKDDKTSKIETLKKRKLRPTFFKRNQKNLAESTENVFKNFLDNVSSSTESSIASVNKSQQSALASYKSRKSDLEIINEIESSQEPVSSQNDKRRSKDLEQSHNADRKLSQNQRATRSRSKTVDISISPNSKAKAALPDEEKGNSTIGSNISDFEVKKRRPGLFRANRKSIATNVFENDFTSEEESNPNKSLGRNSSVNSLQREKDRQPEKQKQTNPSESRENNRLTSIVQANNSGSKLKVRENDFDSESEIDVEYKNDENARSRKEESFKTTLKRKRKSGQASQIVSENHSKLTSTNLTVIQSGEEEELISIGSPGMAEHSNRNSVSNTSKNQNSSFHKSKSTLQNAEYSKQSSRLNLSSKDLEKQTTSDQLSIFNEQPQYESTRKIDVQKSRKSVRESEAKRDSKLSNTKGNENFSKRSTGTEEELTLELRMGQTASLNRSRNLSTKRTIAEEEESNADIEVSNDIAKSSKEETLISKSNRKRKSGQASQILSENHPKLTSTNLTVIESGEEEELISIGSQGIDEHSNRNSVSNTSKNQNSSFHKSKSTLQNVEYSKQSSRLNLSAKDLEKQSTSDQLSIFNEQPQYESTRKIDVQKSRKSVRESEARRDSKLTNTKGNENFSKRSTGTGEELTLELRMGQTASLNRSRNLSSKRTIAEEEESDADIEVFESIAKSSKEESLKSKSNKKRKSGQASQIVSENHPKLTNTNLTVIESGEEEELVSIGSQGIDEHSNRNSVSNTSKNQNSSFHKSKSTLQNVEYSKQSSRLNLSSKDLEKQTTSDQLSIFNEQPQYESTRKIDVQKSRKSIRESEARRDSKLTNTKGNENFSKRLTGTEEELTLELRMGQTASLNRFKNLSTKRTIAEEEESNADIEVSDPKVISIDKNKSNTSNLQESNRSKSTNLSEISKHKSGNITNSLSTTNRKESTDGSERSHTISLSEGQSSEILGDISTPMEETDDNHGSTSFSRSYYKSSDNIEEPLLKDDSSKKQPAKPTITKYEVLNSNNIDLNKLKGSKKDVQTAADSGNNLNPDENNLSRISKSSRTRETPALTSFQHSNIFTKNTHVSTVEEEFSRLYAEENLEIPSTSHGYSRVSRNLSYQDISDKTSKDISKNLSPISDGHLRRTLEYDDESEVSENPLLVYTHNSGEVESDNEQEISSKTIQQEHLSQDKTNVSKQKKINDFFKRKNINRSDKKSTPLNPTKSTITQEQLANARQKIAVITAKVREELFKPQSQELPVKKINIIKKATNQKKKNLKPVDPAYLVNGVVYKQPRLPRPAHWATDRLYKYIWKKIEPKYEMASRVRSEKFVLKLGNVVKKAIRLRVYQNYEQDLENLMREMARMGLIVNRKDFNDFCIEFLPYSFRVKATPMLLPGNKISIPYDPDKLYTPLI